MQILYVQLIFPHCSKLFLKKLQKAFFLSFQVFFCYLSLTLPCQCSKISRPSLIVLFPFRKTKRPNFTFSCKVTELQVLFTKYQMELSIFLAHNPFIDKFRQWCGGDSSSSSSDREQERERERRTEQLQGSIICFGSSSKKKIREGQGLTKL